MKHALLIAFLVITLLGCVVQAQDDAHLDAEQRAALDTVNAAINGLHEAGSYAASGTIDQHLTTRLNDTDSQYVNDWIIQIETIFRFMAGGQLAAAQGSMGNMMRRRSSGANSHTSRGIASFVVIGDQLYQRYVLLVSEYIRPEIKNRPFLNHWHVLSRSEWQAITRGDYNFEAYMLQVTGLPAVFVSESDEWEITGMMQSIDVGLVVDAVVLRDDLIDDQPVVVYEVTLDPFPVMIEGHKNSSSAADAWAIIVNTDAYQAVVHAMREQLNYRQRYWIGVDDQRLYRAEIYDEGEYNTQDIRDALPALSGVDFWPQENMTVTSDTQLVYTFSNFGEIGPVDAPPDATPLLTWFE